MCFEHRWWYHTTAFPAPRSTPPSSTATTPTSFWPTMELWESTGVRSSSDANWKSLLLSRKSASVSDILLCLHHVVLESWGMWGGGRGGGISFCVHGMGGGGEFNLCSWCPVLQKWRTVCTFVWLASLVLFQISEVYFIAKVLSLKWIRVLQKDLISVSLVPGVGVEGDDLVTLPMAPSGTEVTFVVHLWISGFNYYVYFYLASQWLQGAWCASHQRGARGRSQHSEGSAGVCDRQPPSASCCLWRQWSGCWPSGFCSQIYAGWWVSSWSTCHMHARNIIRAYSHDDQCFVTFWMVGELTI